MGLFGSTKPDAPPTEQWIPYRENGEVKYMRADEAEGTGPTGGPTTHKKASGWANHPGDGFVANAPQLLPERYTDESIMPCVVTGIVPSDPKDEVPKKKGLMRFLDKSEKDPSTKVVYMTRGDYKKYFVKDSEGKYAGTEPEQQWTLEDLEERFGKYQKDKA